MFWITSVTSRDWSVWIDTIETPERIALTSAPSCQGGIDLSELIQLKRGKPVRETPTGVASGLICLDWYDWNLDYISNSTETSCGRDWSVWIDTIETHVVLNWRTLFCHVGIDTIETRISTTRYKSCLQRRDWTVWIDTIETHAVSDWWILFYHRRDWSVWIDTIETRVVLNW